MSGIIPTNATVTLMRRNADNSTLTLASVRVQLVVPSTEMEQVAGMGHAIIRHLYDDSGQWQYRRNDQVTVLVEDGKAAPDVTSLLVESVAQQPDPLGYTRCALVTSYPNA